MTDDGQFDHARGDGEDDAPAQDHVVPPTSDFDEAAEESATVAIAVEDQEAVAMSVWVEQEDGRPPDWDDQPLVELSRDGAAEDVDVATFPLEPPEFSVRPAASEVATLLDPEAAVAVAPSTSPAGESPTEFAVTPVDAITAQPTAFANVQAAYTPLDSEASCHVVQDDLPAEPIADVPIETQACSFEDITAVEADAAVQVADAPPVAESPVEADADAVDIVMPVAEEPVVDDVFAPEEVILSSEPAESPSLSGLSQSIDAPSENPSRPSTPATVDFESKAVESVPQGPALSPALSREYTGEGGWSVARSVPAADAEVAVAVAGNNDYLDINVDSLPEGAADVAATAGMASEGQTSTSSAAEALAAVSDGEAEEAREDCEADDDVLSYADSSTPEPEEVLDAEADEIDPEPELVGAGPVSGGMWTIPMLCLGIAIIACCILIPQADYNRRLVYEREKLRRDADAITEQVKVNDEFLRKVADDPSLAERLAQRQMKIVREGTRVLALKSRGYEEAEMSPFHLTAVPPPEPLPPFQSKGGALTRACLDPHTRLYLIGGSLILVASGLVLGYAPRRQ